MLTTPSSTRKQTPRPETSTRTKWRQTEPSHRTVRLNYENAAFYFACEQAQPPSVVPASISRLARIQNSGCWRGLRFAVPTSSRNEEYYACKVRDTHGHHGVNGHCAKNAARESHERGRVPHVNLGCGRTKSSSASRARKMLAHHGRTEPDLGGKNLKNLSTARYGLDRKAKKLLSAESGRPRRLESPMPLRLPIESTYRNRRPGA